MKTPKKDIAVGNRFLYYYANLVDRIYGLAFRREGRNVGTEHFFGTWPTKRERRRQSGAGLDAPRQVDIGHPVDPVPVWGHLPVADEIVLVRFRKRLLLGASVDAVGSDAKQFGIVAEDHRQLTCSRHALMCTTGVKITEDHGLLRTYAEAVRTMSDEIDLREVWELLRETGEPVTVDDVGGLYWADEMDATRRVALLLHLEGSCPFFSTRGDGQFDSHGPAEAADREREASRNQDVLSERAEFVAWLGTGIGEPWEPESLTKRQHGWLDDLKQFVLFGHDADRWRSSRDMLFEAIGKRKDAERAAFGVLVSLGVWQPDENLDLRRTEVGGAFSAEALRAAESVDRAADAGIRRKRIRQLVTVIGSDGGDHPVLGVTVRRRWWRRNTEVGIHIPDVSSWVKPGDALDQAAADRLTSLDLPDEHVPMLPPAIARLCELTVGENLPALSILWRVGPDSVIQDVRLAATRVRAERVAMRDDVNAAIGEAGGKRDSVVSQIGAFVTRNTTAFEPVSELTESQSLHAEAHGEDLVVRRHAGDDTWSRILNGLETLASRAIGTYCETHDLPAIWETQDAPPDLAGPKQIVHPVVRRHELNRQTPHPTLSGDPGFNLKRGAPGLARGTRPGTRYADLVMVRQLAGHIVSGDVTMDRAAMDRVRFEADVAEGEAARLCARRRRYWLLRVLERRIGEAMRAVVLHVRHDGVLVELMEEGVRIVARTGRRREPGDEVEARITSVDLWKLEGRGDC